MKRANLLLALCFFSVLANAEEAQLRVEDGTGAAPQLPAPVRSWLPTINIAPAVGWPEGGLPRAAQGLRVAAFADRLDHPRWLHVLPNGDVLVAETNAPERPEDSAGLKGFVAGLVMKRAGATVPSANRVTLLRDVDGDGMAEQRKTLLDKLNSPFGMAWVGDRLYVADTDALLRFDYRLGADKVDGKATRLAELPGGALNHHWTKSLIANADGSKLYVGVGSNSNVAENGLEKETERAAILEIDAASGARRVFASGLRNPVGMAWEAESGKLWVAVNERDEIGSDLVPDYMTSVEDGAFYGWPWSYFGQHVDQRVQPPRPDMVAKARVPDYALGPHTASLGLAAARGNTLATRFAEGLFIGQHGSWNRKPHSGYKVIFVPFAGGVPAGKPIDVLDGFLSPEGDAYGRPVGVAVDARGGLLVADDVGNTIWRVSAQR
ncbi:MAG TPA: sorbosone dehydrogenase family protein [Fontimonas sp.]